MWFAGPCDWPVLMFKRDQVDPNYFVGLPIPAAATIVATTILFIYQIGGTGSTGYLAVLIMIYVLSFLMVSNIPYPSFKGMKLGERRSFNFLVAVVLLFVLVALEPFVMLSWDPGVCVVGPVWLCPLKKKPVPEPVESRLNICAGNKKARIRSRTGEKPNDLKVHPFRNRIRSGTSTEQPATYTETRMNIWLNESLFLTRHYGTENNPPGPA